VSTLSTIAFYYPESEGFVVDEQTSHNGVANQLTVNVVAAALMILSIAI
jgi:hypothetical protein